MVLLPGDATTESLRKEVKVFHDWLLEDVISETP
jgi:hypothetical protein